MSKFKYYKFFRFLFAYILQELGAIYVLKEILSEIEDTQLSILWYRKELKRT